MPVTAATWRRNPIVAPPGARSGTGARMRNVIMALPQRSRAWTARPYRAAFQTAAEPAAATACRIVFGN